MPISKTYTDMRKADFEKLPILAQRIRILLEREGISLNQLGLKTGIKPSVMKSYIEKPVDIGAENLQKLADAFNVSTDYLLGRTPYRTVKASIISAAKTTGLSESAVSMLHDLANSTYSKTDNDILKVIDILLSDEYYAHDYWHRIYAFLYTTGDDFSLNVPAGNFPVKRDDLLRTLLELNNEYLARIKNVILTGQGGDKLWQAFV